MLPPFRQFLSRVVGFNRLQDLPAPILYSDVYEQLYRAGYHSDFEFSNAKELVTWLNKNLEFNSVLDIGCSHGWALGQFSTRGKTIAGIDPSPTAIEYCTKKGIEAIVGSADKLPFATNQFELVMSTDCFEHLMPNDVSPAIKEAHRVAAKYLAFKICPQVDRGEWKQVVGHDLHLTVMPIRWWMNKFKKLGGEVIYFDSHDTFVIQLLKP